MESAYYISQIVAALGVVGGLVFVGLQIRQNTIAVRSSAFHAVTDSFNEVNLAVAANAELARITGQGMAAGLDDLTPEDRVRFSFTALSVFRVMETIYFQRGYGIADDRLWTTERRTLENLMQTTGIKEWWAENSLSFTPEFRSIVNEAAAAGPSETP